MGCYNGIIYVNYIYYIVCFKDGEFITIGMEGGELKFLGNIGGESLGEDPGRRRRQSQRKPKLNDGKWHSILMRRKNGVIEIIVDGVVVATHKLKNTKASFKGRINNS